MKINKINLEQLKRKGIILVAIPLMLGSLTACHKAENKNRKTEVISESTETVPVINTTTTVPTTTSGTTTTSTSTTTKSTSTTSGITTTSTTATTTTTTETQVYPHELITEEEYNKIMKTDFTKKSSSDLLTFIGKEHTPEQVKQICDIILAKANDEGRLGSEKDLDITIAKVAKNCTSNEMVNLAKEALTTFDADKIVSLNDELKEKYVYMYELYTAYVNAADLKDSYLMIINGAKIYDSLRNFDELLLKNKITTDERLNYFVSYDNEELKESNLFLGESLLKDYFEKMREYVTVENSYEYCEWKSTNYAVQNVFDMIEEQFIVEKINDKYVALKAEENTLGTSKQK